MRTCLSHFGIVLTIALMSLAPGLYAQDNRYDRESQPHMQAALQHLRQAAEELQKADKDKGGHRVQALNLTQQAMNHVQAGIQYDNTHRTKGEKKYKK
jgi:uncharacterized membrane protein (DUF106 family)